MEDAHTTILKMDNKRGGQNSQLDKLVSFFSVFDGHGGSATARIAGERLHEIIANEPEFLQNNYSLALKKGFLDFDTELLSDPSEVDRSGCTSVVVVISEDNTLYCANAGDSRAVLSSAGLAIPLSFDHKPGNEEETLRIVSAGGFVEFGRVNGNLALSRALGDFDFKQSTTLDPEDQIVTANPDITERKLTDADEFLIIACDGIWDVLSNQEAVEFVKNSLITHGDFTKAAEELMDRCLAGDNDMGGVGCDNMTVIVVGILNGKSGEEYLEWIKEIKN